MKKVVNLNMLCWQEKYREFTSHHIKPVHAVTSEVGAVMVLRCAHIILSRQTGVLIPDRKNGGFKETNELKYFICKKIRYISS